MARSDPYVDALGSVPLFSACSRKELGLVAKQGVRHSAEAGEVLVKEGSAGAELSVILEGTARVERHGKKVATLGPGGFFGDLSLLDRAPRNATVIAVTPMELIVLHQRAFDELLATGPGLAKKLLVGLARRLRQEDAKTVQ
jgi:CRP/FNR family transcriptional regulator, cyclic AMP receptor protein